MRTAVPRRARSGRVGRDRRHPPPARGGPVGPQGGATHHDDGPVRAGSQRADGRVRLRDGRRTLAVVTLRRHGKASRTVRLARGTHRLSATVLRSNVLESRTVRRAYRVR
ncbi:hypothetical protein [Aeromicrobium sp. UC242_57]|uniref:hypothetical protein n=1 Tax=Aeromicrobium sp. UC242_57 TaxID=3374624 RepID=UPI003790EC61